MGKAAKVGGWKGGSVKEGPILFSAPMVRAVIDDTKSKTRRVCKARTQAHADIIAHALMEDLAGADDGSHEKAAWERLGCPYGSPGDRLWVRETWGLYDESGIAYDYPNGIPKAFPTGFHVSYPADDESGAIGKVFKWRPSIHMPRWASRILLEVVSVRVERLHDISREDAIAEGIQRTSTVGGMMRAMGWRDYLSKFGHGISCPIQSFASLWISINGAGSWKDNPFVWVVEFRKVEEVAA